VVLNPANTAFKNDFILLLQLNVSVNESQQVMYHYYLLLQNIGITGIKRA